MGQMNAYLDELYGRGREIEPVEEQVRILLEQREYRVSDPTPQLDHHLLPLCAPHHSHSC